MKRKRLLIRSLILLVLGFALVYTLYTNFVASKELVSAGSKAPDFVLTDLNGKKQQLSDYRGKGVILNFWGTWCEPCKREMPFIDRQYQHFSSKGVTVLAVNISESNITVQNFVDQYHLTFPVMIDKDRQVLDAYGVNPLPTSFLIDKTGKVVKVYSGQLTEGMVEKFMEQIKP